MTVTASWMTAIHHNAVNAFHDALNSIDANISFTVEHEANRQLLFLHTLTIRRNNTIHVTVYRKPTHTDRYLEYINLIMTEDTN